MPTTAILADMEYRGFQFQAAQQPMHELISRYAHAVIT
jgi:hypothetical protein